MTTSAVTSAAELRTFLDRVIAQLEEVNGSESIAVADELFWSVPFPEIADPHESPPDLTLGSLRDCLEFLRRDGADVPWMAVWLGQLLIGIGHASQA